MGNNSSKISKGAAVIMVCVAIFIDIAQFLLNFIPGPGWIIIWIVNAIVWSTFYIWFRSKGVNFSGTKKSRNLATAFVFELIPILDALPGWTVAITLTIRSVWKEEKEAASS